MITRETQNMIDYIIACVSEFADRYHLSNREAYFYLRNFNGIGLLVAHYDVMHTLSIENTVDDLQTACYRRGGKIA